MRSKSVIESIEVRSMRETENKREKREKLKRHLQDKELEECTFHPNINRKTS